MANENGMINQRRRLIGGHRLCGRPSSLAEMGAPDILRLARAVVLSTITLACILLSTMNAYASNCSVADQNALLAELPTLKTWAAIHRAFRKYAPQCDDGAMAEGFSDAIVGQLATRWDALLELDRMATADSAFRSFVLRHIDASADEAQLKQVAGNAANRCPSRQKRICTDLASAARRAVYSP